MSRLIEAVLAGEEVVFDNGSTPRLKLVAIANPGFEIGVLEGQLLGDGPDFLEPMSEEDIARWGGGN